MRGAVVALDVLVVFVNEWDATSDAVRPVLGDFDRRFAAVPPIDVFAGFVAVERVAEGAGWTAAHGADDLVHAGAAGCDEGVHRRRERPSRGGHCTDPSADTCRGCRGS
jgi:hypothetical protein